MAQGTRIPNWLSHHLPALGLVLLGALTLCLPAIWNGFPLVYSDTGAYLATAFEGKVPMARPTGYGLFIRYASLGGHIWLPLFAQGLLMAGLLLRTVRVALPQVDVRKAYPLALGAAVGLTGTAWYASQLMPDIFTGLVALTFFLLLFDDGARWWGRLGYAFLAYWFCFAHYSHTAILLLLVALGFGYWLLQAARRRRRPFLIGRLVWALLPGLLAMLSFYYVNSTNGFGWRMTRSAHVFTMARLSETGLLAQYLQETCADQHWALCPYADSLPTSAADFIWREDSPFKKTGFWEGSRPQYDSLLADFFGRSNYVKAYAKVAVQSGLAQLVELSVGEGITPYNESSSPYKFFERAMPAQIPAYVASKQFNQEFSFTWEKWLLYATMVLSSLLLVVGLLGYGRRLSREVTAFALVAILSYALNAFLTGALANVYARLQARIAWLLPLACCFVLVELWRSRRRSPKP